MLRVGNIMSHSYLIIKKKIINYCLLDVKNIFYTTFDTHIYQYHNCNLLIFQ